MAADAPTVQKRGAKTQARAVPELRVRTSERSDGMGDAVSDVLAAATAGAIILSFPVEWYAKKLIRPPLESPPMKPDSPSAQLHLEDWRTGQVVVAHCKDLVNEQKQVLKRMSKGADYADLLIEQEKLNKLTDAYHAAAEAVSKSGRAYRRATGRRPRLEDPKPVDAPPDHSVAGKWLLFLATLMRLPLMAIAAMGKGFATGAGTRRR